jgi:hypothetical protein
MIMSHHQNSRLNYNVRLANESFESVAKFRYLGVTLNQNDIRDEIKQIKFSSCLLSFSPESFVIYLLSKKIRMYKTIILSVVLYGCETWSVTLREEYRLRVFENRVSRRIFGPKREEDGSWRKLHNDELHSLYSSPNIFRVNKSRRMRWAGHVACMRLEDVFTGFGLEGPKGRDHWEDIGVGGG